MCLGSACPPRLANQARFDQKDLLTNGSVSYASRGQLARSMAVWHYAVLDALAVAIRRFVNEPTLIYGVLCDRPSTPFSNWQEPRAWAWLPLLLPRHAPSRPGTCSSNIDSADAVFRKLLYYYYVVPIAWGRQRIEWELWLKGARHAGSPETMLCNSARCSVPKYTCSTM